MLYKWKDNKVVTLLSNFPGTGSTTVLRTQKDERRINFNCPVAVKDYFTFMAGVDKTDTLISSYGLLKKPKKWWYIIFFGLID